MSIFTTAPPSASESASARPSEPRRSPRTIEARAGVFLRARLARPWRAPVLLVVKLVWAGLFAVLLLIAVTVTSALWPAGAAVARYDALVLFAVAVQILFLAFRLETWREAGVILLFHAVGTAMELYKTSIGSWIYPEPGLLKIGAVPLFSGFMYAAVGSFLTRAIRVFDLRFAPFPPAWAAVPLSLAIYVNFFTHHHTVDIRPALFALTVLVFRRTGMRFRVDSRDRRMPLPFAALCLSVPMWTAETIGTLTGTWAYAGRDAGSAAPLATLGSWYLLLYVSFLMVLAVNRGAVPKPGEG